MCVLQPRQLFARAANVLANKLPADYGLRIPEDGPGRLHPLAALLPAAVLCPAPGSAITFSGHPMWGPVLGCRVWAGVTWGRAGMGRTCWLSEAGQTSRGTALVLRDVWLDLF